MEEFVLLRLDEMTPADMFVAGALEPVIEAIRAEVDAHVPDTTTKKGRDAITSIAYKVGKARVRIDNAGKELTVEWRNQTSLVNETRNLLKDTLNDIQDKAKAPLVAWQVEEDKRILAEQKAAEIVLAEAEAYYMHGLYLTDQEQKRVAEMQRKQQESLDRQQAEIAADKQKLVDTENERVRLEQKAADDKIQAEWDEVIRKEKEERDRIHQAHLKEQEEQRIEAARLQAVQVEQSRVAAEAEEKRLEQEKREENKRIVNRVHKDIAKALVGCGLHPDKAIDVCEAIAAGNIPKVSITY